MLLNENHLIHDNSFFDVSMHEHFYSLIPLLHNKNKQKMLALIFIIYLKKLILHILLFYYHHKVYLVKGLPLKNKQYFLMFMT